MTKFTHTTSHATEEAAGQSSLGLQQDGRSSNSTPDHKSGADPIISDILERALSDMEISVRECEELYNVTDADLHLVGMVADELRRRRVGDVASYVVNRNINFTNVCIKQCGFCAFSRDFREEEGYMLPTEEIVKRAEEAHRLGATEVCIQAGLPPDMEGDLYERICRAIKDRVPGMHIHGFSPEEILYGANRSNVSIEEFILRMKDAGVDTLPGTSAEILDQGLRDTISPGRITVRDWERVIRSAHRAGIQTTSTMMFGHLETIPQRVNHMARLRDIQKETGGFTEFVPLNFIHTEAPMYLRQMHNGIQKGGSGRDVLLTHAVARIMFNNCIDNLQMSWVKEGPAMSQMLLAWGANDFGGTLINESISTSAGSGHGQLLKPREIRRIIREAGRIPAERNTRYEILRMFDADEENHNVPAHSGRSDKSGTADGSGSGSGRCLDSVCTSDKLDEADASRFGSYAKLIRAEEFRYKNPRKNRNG